VANQPSGRQNLIRILRRRLGLTQKELARLLGYGSDSQISRLESGSRIPTLFEALILELVFEMGSALIFDTLREEARHHLLERIEQLKAELAAAPQSNQRVSYKAGQLERIVALLQSLNGSDSERT
jgi:transcriptional regulator with XRE-family HTH domain